MKILQHILSYRDAILGPIYFLLLLLWIICWKKKYYKNSPLKKYIIPAFILKTFCCLLLAFLYEFYYGFGDIHNYYTGAVEIWNATKQNPLYGLELVFKPFEKCSPAAQEFATNLSNPIFAASIVNMFKIGGLIGMFCFGAYLPIAFFITLLSFIGSWKIFTVFAEEFPAHYKKLALTCLFAPSFIFWSTNLLKDPLCIFGLGLCVRSLYNLMKGRFSFFIVLEMVTGAFIMLSLKSYIFYIFCFAGFWSMYINIISNVSGVFRVIIKGSMFIALVLGTVWAISARGFLAEFFSNNFFNDVTTIQNVQKDQGGSVYVLSDVDDNSFLGIIRTYLRSLNVALFRPYLWEIPNVIAIANAIESFIILFFTVYLLLRLKVINFFRIAGKNRILTFSIIFTLMLAPLAGLVSFNFGTLVRYKAPFVPFYYSYLVIVYYKTKKNDRKLL